MIARATVRYVRANPTKTRCVADLIRGRKVGEALQLLKYNKKYPARIISKLLDSAVANAQVNREIDVEALIIHRIFVDQGPAFRRFRARAMGRVARIRKRTSHITVVLDEI
ncbi:MAG: 50S ribosomal protein L22 [Deltaproteobacteria bacterium]|nr:50S ribosomal protein L22 [Deltaproteobacteria bacterium]